VPSIADDDAEWSLVETTTRRRVVPTVSRMFEARDHECDRALLDLNRFVSA
jgi:hypothetical protein